MSSVNLHWLAENFSAQDPVVFDIGCADMSDTLRIKQTLRYYKSPGAKFYAFDCSQYWLDLNTQTADANDINYFHIAVSDSNGPLTFYPSEFYEDRVWPWSGSIFQPGQFYKKWKFGDGYTVESMSLTSFCDREGVAPDIIHIDAQGAEYNILNNLVAKPRCIWTEISEFQRYNTEVSYYDFDKMLTKQGYQLLYRNAHDALYVDSQTKFTEYDHYYHSPTIEETILSNIWIEKYHACRGEDWPEINSSADYDSLPEWIKQECQEFGIDIK